MGCQASKISSEAHGHGPGQQATMPEPSTMDDSMEGICGKLDAQTQTETRKPFLLLDWDSIVCCDGDCSLFWSSNEAKTDPNPAVSHLEGRDDTSQTIGIDTENESETSEPNPAEADSDEDEHQSENNNTELCAVTVISTQSIDAGIKTKDGCDAIHQEQSVNEDGDTVAEEKGEIGGHMPETETIPDTEEKASLDTEKAIPHAEIATVATGEKAGQSAEKATMDSQKETPDVEALTTTPATEKATQTEWSCTCPCMGSASLDDVDGAMPQANLEQSEHPVGECETVTRSSENKERTVCETESCDKSVGTVPIPAANEPEYKVKGSEVVMHRIEIQRRIEERRLKAFRDHIQREAVGRREREMTAEDYDNGDYNNENDDITISSCVSAPVGARQFSRIEDRRRKAFEAHLRRRSLTRLAPTGQDR